MTFDLTGCYDLHIHTSPDVIPRKLSDLEMAEQAKKAGMAGFTIKSHKFPTAGRAAAVRTLYPGLDVISGIALNNSVGGINPDAVEAAAKMGIRMVWLPTVDARAYRKLKKRVDWEEGLTLLTPEGTIRKEAREVAEIVKQYDLVFCTGHIGAEEAEAFVELCRGTGVKRFALTHVTFPICQMAADDLKTLRRRGAMIEYSYTHILTGVCDFGYVVRQLKELGSSSIYLSTDLGQTENMMPADGMAEFLGRLAAAGIPEEELYKMARSNPAALIR